MNFHFPTLSLLTIALLLSPALQPTGIAQTAPTPNAYQTTQLMGDRTMRAYFLLQQGTQQFYSSQYQLALESSQQALDLYRELGNRPGEGNALNVIGIIYLNLGQSSRAFEMFQQALAIQIEVGNHFLEGVTLTNLGEFYNRSGQYSQALDSYQQALVISRETGSPNRLGEGVILNGMGDTYVYLGRYSRALDYYQQALVILGEVGNRAMAGATLSSVGLVHIYLGQFAPALHYLQQGLVLRREAGDRIGEGRTLSGIGGVYVYLGQYPQAVEQFQQALVIAREVGDRTGEGVNFNNIGAVYYSQGQYSQAAEQFQQALAIYREVGDRPHQGEALNNIGSAYDGRGQYLQASEHYEQALAIAREVRDRAGEGRILGNIGMGYVRLEQYPQAVEQFQQALAIYREVGDRPHQGEALNNIGTVQLLSGQFAAATDTLFQAVEIRESLRAPQLSDASKIALIDTQNDSYDYLQQTLIAQNEFETALEVAERGRARAFVELLTQQTSSNASNPSIAISAPTITQIKQIAREQNATLVEYSIVTAPVRIEGRTEWQPLKLCIWVVKPTGEVTFRLVDLSASDASLDTIVALGRQAIGARGRGFDLPLPPQIGRQPEQTQDQLQQLYQLLIEPIADLLPTDPNDHVVFIPQGELFSVPFPALQDTNGKYLIENHTILTAPSIQVLGLTHQVQQSRSIASSQALIVGNPTMPTLPALPPNPPQQLSALPGSEQEAIAIARQFHTQPLLGGAATETAVVQRMSSAQIIHLATHGLLDYGDPQASGVRDFPGAIALAPSAQDDGLLTSSEILNLRLQANLVVLSACDTGLGRMSADGVVGLSRSLLSAGASSVMVSLWKVPDDATEVLMSEFYRQLRQQPDKAQALRQAMLQTMQEYPDPIDWAAFTLIGEAE